MCFSAGASFGAAGFLLVVGITTLIKTKAKKDYMLAAIPLLLSIQQASEGVVWLSFMKSSLSWLRSYGAHSFLTFAFIVWPSWISTAFWYRESIESRKKYLFGCMAIGFMTSLALACSIFFNTVFVRQQSHHIVYDVTISSLFFMLLNCGYIISVIVPCFISSKRFAPLFGCFLALSYAVSYWWYTQAFISVWCFFSALLSCMLFFIIN